MTTAPAAIPDVVDADKAFVERFGFKIVPVNHPYTALARAVLKGSVKNIKLCPRTLLIPDMFTRSLARSRLMRALEALEWAWEQPEDFLFWCEVAEIGPDWLSERMKTLAQSKNLLMKAWEAQK